MLKYIKTELFRYFESNKFDVLLHGCNCFCDMKDGFARHVRLLYPVIYEIDLATNKGDESKLGCISFGQTENGIIVNMYTQYHGGENFDLDAFTMCMEKVSELFSNRTICMPKIGCGIGGGSWNEIEHVLNEKFSHLDITVFDFEPRNNELY